MTGMMAPKPNEVISVGPYAVNRNLGSGIWWDIAGIKSTVASFLATCGLAETKEDFDLSSDCKGLSGFP
jgi:hypothetical protein